MELTEMTDTSTAIRNPNHSDGCESPVLGPGVYNRMLAHGGWARDYVLAVPEVPAGMSASRPLLVAMHGFGGNGASMRYMLEQGVTFEDEYIVAYPDGAATSNSLRGWNSGHPECCGTALQLDIDDVGFIRALVDSIAQESCVDLDRVYATGFSNGADMAQRLACDASDLVAAVASVAGRFDYQATACPGKRPVSAMLYRGQLDRSVPFENDLLSLLAIDTVPAMEGFAQIAANHGCEGNVTDSLSLGNAECIQANDCRDGIELTLCSIPDAAHCWPGIGNCADTRRGSGAGTSVSEHMRRFFSRHTLRP